MILIECMCFYLCTVETRRVKPSTWNYLPIGNCCCKCMDFLVCFNHNINSWYFSQVTSWTNICVMSFYLMGSSTVSTRSYFSKDFNPPASVNRVPTVMGNPGNNCCHGKSWKSLGIWKFPKKSWKSHGIACSHGDGSLLVCDCRASCETQS